MFTCVLKSVASEVWEIHPKADCLVRPNLAATLSCKILIAE